MKNEIRPSLRPALLAVGVLGSTVLLGALGAAQERMTPMEGRSQTAAQRFKNIKVLKKLPANQLIPTMHMINTSLGVDCEFCHVRGPGGPNFASDEKPTKNMARQMITMTQSLNAHQKIIDNKATCYMCHHGHPQPEVRPALSQERPGEPPPPPPAPPQ